MADNSWLSGLLATLGGIAGGTGGFFLGGPVGAAGGAAAGAGLGGSLGASLGGDIGGSEARQINLERYTPEQNNVLDMLLQQGAQNSNFSGIENYARQNFRQQTVPSIAERFSALGAQRSSAFPQILGAAGAGLEGQLGALKSQYGLQQLQQGLTPRYDSAYQQRQPGFFEQNGPALIGMGLQSGIQGYGAKQQDIQFNQQQNQLAELIKALQATRT